MDAKILVVDDDRFSRLIVKNAIETELNFKVDQAANPKEAFEYLEKNKPVLIIMDMLMPIMNGLEAVIQLKSNSETENIAVIAYTSVGTEHMLAQLIKLKINGFIVKPSSRDIVLAKIKEVLVSIDYKLES